MNKSQKLFLKRKGYFINPKGCFVKRPKFIEVNIPTLNPILKRIIMKRFLLNSFMLGVSLTFLQFSSNAQYQLDWVKELSDEAGVWITGQKLDANNNIYVCGFMYASSNTTFDLDFDQAGNAKVDLEEDLYSSFVAKYNNSGSLVWVRHFGGDDCDVEFRRLDLDANGNVHIIGYLSGDGTVDFDPGSGTANLSQDSEFGKIGYVLKLNSNGDFAWINKISRDAIYPNLNSAGVDLSAISVSSTGDVYVSGRSDNQINFGNSNTMIMSHASQFQSGFLVKYNSAGAYQWSKAFVHHSNQTGSAVRTCIFSEIHVGSNSLVLTGSYT